MRSHLLAKVARDDERNASGRAPDIFVFWSGEAWAEAAARRRLRGCRAECSRCWWREGTWRPRPRKSPMAWCLTAVLSIKMARRMLWHGAWRGSALGRYARQSVAPAAAKPMLALAPEPGPTSGCKGVYGPCGPRRRQSKPDGQGFRDGHERERRARARDRRLHFAERSRQGPQERRGGLRHRLARQPSVERQGRPRMDQARPLRSPPRRPKPWP